MVRIEALTAYINELLDVPRFRDYSPNGLQVEGDRPVRRLVTGVTASQAFLETALARDADAMLVHHGYFWKGEPSPIVGPKARRIGRLLGAGAHLLAYHLPLDAHPEFGNNVELARRLGIEVEGQFPAGGIEGLGWYGRLPAQSAQAFAETITATLGRAPTLIDGGGHAVETIAWCTGAAQDFIEQAADLGVDAYLSGEIAERTTHSARELGVHYYAAGHHASERYGVQALGAHLAERFGLEHEYVDIDNPA